MRFSAMFLTAVAVTMSAPLFGADLQMIANQSLKGKLTIRGQAAEVSGSTSLLLKTSERDLQNGILKLQELNVRYDKVNQKLLSGRSPQGGETGVLGFSALPLKDGHVLKYDRQANKIAGTIAGKLDFPQLRELAPPRLQDKLDIYLTPTQDADVEIQIDLDGPIDLGQAASAIVELVGNITLKISAKRLPSIEIPPYIIEHPVFSLLFRYTFFSRFEVARELCLQPVRFRASLTDSPTGNGWSFGLPGAESEWKKGDVVFKLRSFKTVTNPALLAATQAEMGTILSQVEDDDCIEIFFPEEFIPNDLFGGGATFGSGTASAQIVSSDENALHGIDLTHLAHELGHVLGLHHPGAGFPTAARPEVIDGSSGTLMCPSGFMNDNPDVNSGENEDNVHNPLLTFAFKLSTAAPDCADSADCGPCP